MEAYRKPRATEEEKVERRRAIEAALRGAAEVPLEVMRACRAGLTAAVDVARAGNPSASSDIGVSVELLKAALHSAALNVGVNLSSLSDSNYVDAVTTETATPRELRRGAGDGGPLGAQLSVTTTTWSLKSQGLMYPGNSVSSRT